MVGDMAVEGSDGFLRGWLGDRVFGGRFGWMTGWLGTGFIGDRFVWDRVVGERVVWGDGG